MGEYPNDDNGDLFRKLESQDFDFSKEYLVEFFAVFATEEEAEQIGYKYVSDKKAGERIVNVETRPYPEGGMELEIVNEMLLTYENIIAFEQKFRERISTVEGYFDGWGFLHDQPYNNGKHTGQIARYAVNLTGDAKRYVVMCGNPIQFDSIELNIVNNVWKSKRGDFVRFCE